MCLNEIFNCPLGIYQSSLIVFDILFLATGGKLTVGTRKGDLSTFSLMYSRIILLDIKEISEKENRGKCRHKNCYSPQQQKRGGAGEGRP